MGKTMSKKVGEHYEYNVRQWILDSAISANKKGTKADKILKDAEKFYGFIFPENGKVKVLKNDHD